MSGKLFDPLISGVVGLSQDCTAKFIAATLIFWHA